MERVGLISSVGSCRLSLAQSVILFTLLPRRVGACRPMSAVVSVPLVCCRHPPLTMIMKIAIPRLILGD